MPTTANASVKAAFKSPYNLEDKKKKTRKKKVSPPRDVFSLVGAINKIKQHKRRNQSYAGMK